MDNYVEMVDISGIAILNRQLFHVDKWYKYVNKKLENYKKY